MPNNKDLTEKIMHKVESQQMRPKWYFMTWEGVRMILVGLLLLGAVFLVSFFIWDLLINWWVLNESEDALFTALNASWFEFALVGLILIGLIYIIYRHTDWLLVRNRLLLVAIIMLMVLITSGLLVTAALSSDQWSQPFEQTEQGAEQLPLIKDRRERLRQELEKKKIFVGRVVEVERRDLKEIRITVENPEVKEVFVMKGPGLKLRKGQMVAIHFDDSADGLKKILRVQPIRPGERSP